MYVNKTKAKVKMNKAAMALSLFSFVTTTLLIPIGAAQKFDPYQLNGGLVAAVAGKDYVLIASDTRLTDGGYGINSRKYLSGRIWSASSSTSLSTFSSNAPTDSPLASYSPAPTPLALKRFPAQWESDGSLVMPSINMDYHSGSRKITPKQEELDPSITADASPQTNMPIMIGSAGCASDCESLKRRVRLELDALECTVPFGSMGVQSVANLLQQILYGRRGFPYYSFCVVAGIDDQGSHCGGPGSGAVYVYDAIGSYERVAVASAGTGRELLQPILDRVFSETLQNPADKQVESRDEMRRDIMAVAANKQRMGVAGSLRPPVQTTVNCSWEKAVKNVARAYRSVAEREISVGDEVVICVASTSASETRHGHPVVGVFRFPLKKH